MDQSQQNRIAISELLEQWTPYADDLLLHDPDGPGECVVRGGEIVADGRSLESVVTRLGRWVDGVHDCADRQNARVRLRPAERNRCVEIARDVSSAVSGVAPNHVHFGSSVMYGEPVMYGTGRSADPVPEVEEPVDQCWSPRITVGVLDTGLDAHPWFARRPWFEEVPETLDADDDSGQDRQAGHGTFVSGLVLRNAPGVVLRPVPVLSSLGFTDDIRVAGGLRALRSAASKRDEPVDVVLLPSGCHTPDDACPPILRDELAALGSVVVAAAGNHRSRRPFWPAALSDVIGVAATGPDGAIAEFSNSGSWVDSAAPGVDVVSSYVRLEPASRDGSSRHGTSRHGVVRDGVGEGRSYGFARWSGTSFAAPQVAGKVATMLHRGYEPALASKIANQAYPFEG